MLDGDIHNSNINKKSLNENFLGKSKWPFLATDFELVPHECNLQRVRCTYVSPLGTHTFTIRPAHTSCSRGKTHSVSFHMIFLCSVCIRRHKHTHTFLCALIKMLLTSITLFNFIFRNPKRICDAFFPHSISLRHPYSLYMKYILYSTWLKCSTTRRLLCLC